MTGKIWIQYAILCVGGYEKEDKMYAMIFTKDGEVMKEWHGESGHLMNKLRAHDMLIPLDWEYDIICTEHEFLDSDIIIEEYAKRKRKELAA